LGAETTIAFGIVLNVNIRKKIHNI
jgi:hypothetical protein